MKQIVYRIEGNLVAPVHKLTAKDFAKKLALAPLMLALGLTQADYVELALGATETTETNLGTITIPSAGVRAIVGVYGILQEISTTAEQGVGYFRLAFKTVAGTFKFPCSTFQAPAGTLASPGFMYEPKIIPVNIPVPSNETITAYMATFVAATGACRGMVGVLME